MRTHRGMTVAALCFVLTAGGCQSLNPFARDRQPQVTRPTGMPVVCDKPILSSGFGRRNGKPHNGVDISAPKGSRVVVTADGQVVFTGRVDGYGRLVRVAHGDGYESWYCHLKRIKTKRGKHLRRGDTIGLVGKSGNASGPHLHYEVRLDGRPVDPKPYF